MQEKTTKNYDKKNRLTLRGLYEDAIVEIKEELKKRPHLKQRTISYSDFRKIVRCYFDLIFERLYNGLSYDLYNRMGTIRIVKTKLTRYRPSYYKPENVNDSFTEGYWHFVFWDAPKKWRMYEIKLGYIGKRLMMKKVNRGFEYPDYTQQNNDGYIRKVK